MKIIAFVPEHAQRIKLQKAQATAIIDLPLEYLDALQHAGTALTAISNGEIIACGGIARTDGYGTLWGYISQDAGKCFVALDRIVRRLLETCNLQRIEATVQADFAAGERWLALLGFKMEKPLPNYVLGQDHTLWVK